MIDYMTAMTIIQCGEATRAGERRRAWRLAHAGETGPARVARIFPRRTAR